MTPRYVKQKIELKGIKAGSSRQRSSLTRRQVTRLLLKTTVERFQAVMPLFKAREELSHWGVEMRVKRTS
jgi:hypothetical protein